MAFITTAAVPIKSITGTSVCTTNTRRNTVTLRRSAFAGANVKHAHNLSQVGVWGLTMQAVPMVDVVTQKDVMEAQKLWANGVVKIGSLKDNKTACEEYTDQFLNERYAFNIGSGKVLFKPTKCAVQQFRPTKPDAVSYFIAGDKKKYVEDGGFAVTPWTNIRFENAGFILESDRAVAMGNYYFTDLSGGITKVEYTFGYKKVDGQLKIDLHHSSLPFPA